MTDIVLFLGGGVLVTGWTNGLLGIRCPICDSGGGPSDVVAGEPFVAQLALMYWPIKLSRVIGSCEYDMTFRLSSFSNHL